MTGPGSSRPVGAQHPYPALGRPAPQRNANLLEQLQGLRGRGRGAARHRIELGEVGERGGRRRRGAELQRREGDGVLTAGPLQTVVDGLAPRMRLHGELVRHRRQDAQPLAARAGLAEAGEHPWGRLPAGDQLVRRSRLAAQQAALDPVADSLWLARTGAHEGEQLPAAPLWEAGMRQCDQPAACGGAGERHRRLDSDRDPESREDPAKQGPAALGLAQHHRDVASRDAGGEQSGYLAAHRLRLAPLAAAFEQRDPLVGLDAAGAGLEQVSVEMS